MTRTSSWLAFAGGLLLASPLFAAAFQPNGVPSAPTETATGEPTSATSLELARALATVRPDRISADLHFIASDEMGGRNTPSQGLEVAANFLRARLQRLEFQPGAGEGYFFEYPLTSTALDLDACTASWSTAEAEHNLKLGSDYFLSVNRLSASSEASGPIISIGEGSTDELEKLELEGAWALVLDRKGSRVMRVVREVKKRGAVGVIVVPSADYSGDPLTERFGGKRFEGLVRGRTNFPRPDGERKVRQSLPVVHFERAVATNLLAACASSTEAADWFPPAGAKTGLNFKEQRTIQGNLAVKNVCGMWPGADPVLSKEVIIVSAHYDHVGTRDGKIFNGADDNGSGTSGVLAVAEALKAYGPMRRSVLLIWVSGEERGLWGSKAWANNPLLPEGHSVVANLNIDMIGRNDPHELFITPTKEHKQFNVIAATAMKLAPLEGFPKLESADEYYHRSDQAEFARLKIPVAFLFAGVHEDYHQPTDTPDKIDYDKLSRVVRLVVRLLDDMQSDTFGG